MAARRSALPLRKSKAQLISQPPVQPDLSVLMASFNAGAFIARSIESVLSVKDLDVELIIQDGLSTDSTAAIVAGFDDPRIKFVSEADEGQSDAWNRALARAGGRWIGWLNADDIYSPAGVERLSEHFDEPLDFIYGDYASIDRAGGAMKRYRSDRPFTQANLLRYGVYVNCSAGFYNPELLRTLGGLDRSLHYCMDYDLLLRLSRSGARSLYVPARVQCLRVHADAKTSQHALGFVREGCRVAFRNTSEVRGGRFRVLRGLAILLAYLITRPIWQTSAWGRIRPEKQL